MLGPEWMNVAFVVIVIAVVVRSMRRDTSVGSMLVQVAFAFYATRVAALTFFPLPIDPDVIAREQELAAMGIGQTNNFELFGTVGELSRRAFALQVYGNLVLLTPLGVLAPVIWRRYRSVVSGTALVVGTALAIETTQLAGSLALGFTYRSFDVDDLWLNTLGGIGGLVIGRVVAQLMGDGEPEEADDVATRPQRALAGTHRY